MPKKSLRAQLNQIRAWVRQGRTDAWIAHQLEVPASELREFRRRHELTPEGDEESDVDLRDEIEAEIEAARLAEDEEDEDDQEEDEDREAGEAPEAAEEREEPKDHESGQPKREDGDGDSPSGGRRRRRRGRRGRGGGGGAAGAKTLEGTFDHGEEEGYGLWLDPALADNPVYSEHWAGKRSVEVRVEPDRITIRRT